MRGDSKTAASHRSSPGSRLPAYRCMPGNAADSTGPSEFVPISRAAGESWDFRAWCRSATTGNGLTCQWNSVLEMIRELWLRSPARPFGEWAQVTRSRGVGSKRLGSLPPKVDRRGNWYPRMLVAKATDAEEPLPVSTRWRRSDMLVGVRLTLYNYG